MSKLVEFIQNPYMPDGIGSVNHHTFIAYQNAKQITDEYGNVTIVKEPDNRQMRPKLYEGLTVEQCLWRSQCIDNSVPLHNDLKTPEELAAQEGE